MPDSQCWGHAGGCLSMMHIAIVYASFSSLPPLEQAGFKPAEFKLRSHLSQWCQIEAVVHLDSECYVPSSPITVPAGGKAEQKRGTNLSQAQARVCYI